MFTVCRITDGTTTVDLLHAVNGFSLRAPDGWIPARLGVKGDGVWADNPLSDGRRLVFESFANVIDTLSLTITGGDPDTIAYYSQELARLLEKAKDYWKSSWRTEPVWWEVCANETGMRYATIKGYQTPQDSNPFTPEFLTSLKKSMRDFLLIIEHEPWQDVAPGQSTCVKISNLTTADKATNRSDPPEQRDDDARIDSVAAAIGLGSDNSFGRTGAGAAIYSSGIRFRSVNVPPGVTIKSATIRLVASTNQAGATCNLLINGESNVAPAEFSTYANFTGRATTTASVTWSAVPAWTQNSEYFTPDISGIVQEIIDLPGWAALNNMAFFVRDNTSTNGAYRDAYSWDTAGAGQIPMLYITYTDGTQLTFGQEATCEPDVFFANVENTAQLTHVFYYDSAAAAYSANLIGAALPITLMPTVVGPDIPVVNDILYYGVAAPGVDGGPFWNIVHDIGTAIAGVDGTWEYWTGAAWSNLEVTAGNFIDGTNEFAITGVNSISWYTAGDIDNWAITAVNGVAAYWVRFRITAAAGAPSPTQVNRVIYTVTTSHADIDASEVSGDIPALALYTCNIENGEHYDVFYAVRDAGRGLDFRKLLYFSDIQTYDYTVATSEAFIVDETYSTSHVVQVSCPTGGLPFITITVDEATAAQYSGKYRAFLQTTGGAGIEFNVAMTVYPANGATVFFDKTITISTPGLTDMGIIEIPNTPSVSASGGIGPAATSGLSGGLVFQLFVTSIDAGDVDFVHLVLFPVDEFCGVYSGGTTGADDPEYFILDSCSYPKDRNYAWMFKDTGDYAYAPMTPYVRRPNLLIPNTDQRLHIFTGFSSTRMPLNAMLFRYNLRRVSRYISMRGAR